MQPLKDIHLESNLNQEAEVNGNGKIVSFLMWIALAILLIAWVNYINLSTSRAIDRAKEVGIRKVVGAERTGLIYQFVLESFLINIMALLVAFGLVLVSLPFFRELIDKPLEITQLFSNHLWLTGLSIFAIGTLLSSLYPAFVLSNYQPIAVLKGRFSQAAQGIFLRKSLIVLQFTASVVLIVGTITVFRQLTFMQNQDLGFTKEQMLVFRAPRITDNTFTQQRETFKQTLINQNLTDNITVSAYIPGIEILWTSGFTRKDKTNAGSVTMFISTIDYDFLDVYKIPVTAGRNFSKTFGTDTLGVILNETAVKTFGFNSPEEALNKEILTGDTFHVIGVVKDYHQQGLKKAKDPMAIFLTRNNFDYFSMKVKTANVAKTLTALNTEFNRTFPGNPFEYYFLDDFFNQQYKAEMQFGKVFTIFACLAIFIASLGLLGLIAFTVVSRTREIGIRKVLGAQVSTIVYLLTKDFLFLVVIAIFVAIPLSWYLMNQWLGGFAYRVNIGFGVFVLAGILAVLITFITISYEAIKAALANPVKSLRTE